MIKTGFRGRFGVWVALQSELAQTEDCCFIYFSSGFSLQHCRREEEGSPLQKCYNGSCFGLGWELMAQERKWDARMRFQDNRLGQMDTDIKTEDITQAEPEARSPISAAGSTNTAFRRLRSTNWHFHAKGYHDLLVSQMRRNTLLPSFSLDRRLR
jgi:hypothetical protein